MMAKLVVQIKSGIFVTIDKKNMDLAAAGRLAKDIGVEGVGKTIDGVLTYFPPHRIEEIEIYGEVVTPEDSKDG
jgi:hypothetical protein